MPSVLEQQGEHIAESVHRVCRAASAFTDAVEERVKAARRVVKQGGDAAEEFLDDTTKRLQRHPVESIVLATVVGIVAGILMACKMMRRPSQVCESGISEK